MTVKKYQPPAIDIMLYHTRPVAANESSSRKKRCHQDNFNRREAATKSSGTDLSETKNEKVMFQAWPVKIVSTDAISRPKFRCGNKATNPSTSPGKKPRMGMLCRMSSTGNST